MPTIAPTARGASSMLPECGQHATDDEPVISKVLAMYMVAFNCLSRSGPSGTSCRPGASAALRTQTHVIPYE